jgi:tRNA(Arg) A34 adenosine deaminase TadA
VAGLTLPAEPDANPSQMTSEQNSGREIDSRKRFPLLHIGLPEWMSDVIPPSDYLFDSIEERMQLAIELSRMNVSKSTGGPFGAAVFEIGTGRLVAPGVNIVLSSGWSGGHGEVVALAIAQKLAGTHDLGGSGMPALELVTSTEPCAMCMGATVWSGVKRLVCGARDEDARSVGFDEGPKPVGWVNDLESRGISVIRDVMRKEARSVLQDYVAEGGILYNGRSGYRSSG